MTPASGVLDATLAPATSGARDALAPASSGARDALAPASSGVLDALLSEPEGDARRRAATAWESAAGSCADRIVLMGAGGLGRRLLAGLRADGIEPLAFADNRRSLWGTDVDGVEVLAPADAAARFGRTAAFAVAIWGAGSSHRFEHSAAQLSAFGCTMVLPVAPLAWRHAQHVLPHYAMDLPHGVVACADDVRAAYALLGDQRSRDEFVEQVRFRLTGDPSALARPVRGPQYLLTDVAAPVAGEVVVDCGAYDGDTLTSWLNVRGPTFSRYIALEPDPDSRARLVALVDGLADDVRDRVTVLPWAAAATRGTARFSPTGTAASALGDAIATGTGTPGGDGGCVVECRPLDDVLAGEAPTFVKMDIEGAEPGALEGGRTVLAAAQPVLAVSAYHAQDHLWRLPLLVHDILPDHALALRPHNEEGWDLVLYAAPPSRAV
ncbi:MAG TPA: FkbM family methyltransferase [Acidimicrobiales bacterium]|nr:FkbM family methyltransferase [Acidimicrobiales bacterium]